MSKTYILEPVEMTFEGELVEISGASDIFDAIADGAIIEFSGTKLKYAGVMNENQKVFTVDGSLPEDQPEVWAAVVFSEEDEFAIPPTPAKCKVAYSSSGTYTVSIYTETEDDSDFKPYIDTNLSKNVTHNDHPYNAVERIRSKLKQKAEQGDDDSESSENVGYSVKKTEDVRVTGFSTSEVYSENNKTGFEIPIGFANIDGYPTEYVIEGDYEYKWSDESSSKQRHFKGIVNQANLTYSELDVFIGSGELIAIDGDDNGDIIIMRPGVEEMKAFGVTLSPISLSNVTVTAVYYDISVTEEFFKAVEFVVNSLQ